MIDFKKLVGYRKGIRPVQPESFPTFVDRELERLGLVSNQIVDALKSVNTTATGTAAIVATGDDITAPAGETLGGNRAVYVAADGKAYYADRSTATARFMCGVTVGAAAIGSTATIRIQAVLTDATWSWTTGDIVWLSTTGLLTQVLPATPGYLAQVGVPVGPTRLRIEPQLIAKI